MLSDNGKNQLERQSQTEIFFVKNQRKRTMIIQGISTTETRLEKVVVEMHW